MKKLIKNDHFSKDQAIYYSEMLKALGHPIRLRIIDILSQGEMCVGDLAENLGEKQAIVSQQLKILKMVGLLNLDRRSGRSYYSLPNDNLVDLLGCIRQCNCE